MTALVHESRGFQLLIPGLEGGLEGLERLVSSRRLEITDIPVAELTRQYSEYLNRVPQPVDLDDVGAFVATAARLLTLKSGFLLARPAEEEDFVLGEEAPSTRLPAGVLATAVSSLSVREGKESLPPLSPHSLVTPRLSPRDPAALSRAWEGLRRRAEPVARRVRIPPFARLEAALSTLIRRLQREPVLSLRRILRGASREEAVLHFVATLELIRRRQVRATQHELFGDITLEEDERPTGSAARAV